MSNLFSFHARNSIKLNKSIHSGIELLFFFTCFIENLLNFSLPLSHIQSTLVISNSKGLSEILRDIRSSTYQVCRIEEKII